MVVHKLLFWRAAEGGSEAGAVEVLTSAILSLRAASHTKWSAHLAAYKPPSLRDASQGDTAAVASAVKDLYRVSLSDSPDALLFVAKGAKQVVAGSPGLQAQLERLTALKPRSSLLLEGSGYGGLAGGDFSVCVARAVQKPGDAFLGLVLDVGYEPLDDLEGAEAVLQDMAEILQEAVAAAGGTLRVASPSLEGFQLPQQYSLQHRAVQYVLLTPQLAGSGSGAA